MPNATSCSKWILAGATLAMALVAALNWQTLLFAFAVAFSETRPKLLSDAGWGDPRSAHQFNRRFAAGTPEGDLVAWLQASGFTLDQCSKTAERLVKDLPCSEMINVNWGVNASGKLERADAAVTEAGCL